MAAMAANWPISCQLGEITHRRSAAPRPPRSVAWSAARTAAAAALSGPLPHHAAKTQMAGGAVNRLGHARRRPVAAAIVRGAKEGPALHDFPRNGEPGRLQAAFARAAARIVHGAAATGRDGMARLVPIPRPFPDIADHVVKAIAVGR